MRTRPVHDRYPGPPWTPPLPTPPECARRAAGRGWPATGTVGYAFSLIPLLLTGCGDGGATGTWSGSVRDSAGVRIVENPERGFWTAAQAWRLEEELLIGVGEGDPELQFGSIVGLDADEQGRIYVLDGQASRVRIFNPDGTLLRAFGRRGEGPGEISQAAQGLLLAADGSILIPDMMNQRVTRLSPQGEPLEGSPLDISRGIPLLFLRGGDGRPYAQVRIMSLPGMAMEGEPRDIILALGPTGAVMDTVAVLAAGETFQFGGAAGGMPTIRMFSPEPVWTVTTDGRLVGGLNTPYSLTLHDGTGAPATIVRRESPRRPVTDQDIRGFRRLMREAWMNAGVPEAMAAQMEGMIQFAEVWPALAALLAGPDGTLWVQRVDPDRPLDAGSFSDPQSLQIGSPGWDVFDPEGRYLGVVETPENLTPRRVVGSRLYGVLIDDLGVQRVARYRILQGEG